MKAKPFARAGLSRVRLQSSADAPGSSPASGIQAYFDSILLVYDYNCEFMVNRCLKLSPIWDITSSQYTRSLVGMLCLTNVIQVTPQGQDK